MSILIFSPFANFGNQSLRLQDLTFFDPLPPSVYIFYVIKVYKKLNFLNIFLPPLVNVVCERLIALFMECWAEQHAPYTEYSIFSPD